MVHSGLEQLQAVRAVRLALAHLVVAALWADVHPASFSLRCSAVLMDTLRRVGFVALVGLILFAAIFCVAVSCLLVWYLLIVL